MAKWCKQDKYAMLITTCVLTFLRFSVQALQILPWVGGHSKPDFDISAIIILITAFNSLITLII